MKLFTAFALGTVIASALITNGLLAMGLNGEQVAFIVGLGGVTLVSGVAGAVGMFRGMKNGEEG